jgi:hypothetical protein
MRITPTAVAYAVQYAQAVRPADPIRQSIMQAMEYSGYVQQAMKEKKQEVKSTKGRRIDIRI